MQMKLVKRTLSAALLFGLAGSASAAGFSGSLTLTSDYLFRGFTQTNEKPALQGGLEWESESGLYVGTWGSSISWLSDADADISSQVELDGYAGYRGSFGDDVSYDVGVVKYWYPGDFPKYINQADSTEVYFGLSYSLFSLKYSYALTDLFGIDNSDGSSYIEAGVDYGFADTWSVNGHVGKQYVSGHDAGGTSYDDILDWSVGISKTLPWDLAVDLKYVDTDVDGADSTVFFAITKSF